MEENRMHVRVVPMTADHLDEVAELERICFSVPWSRNMLAEELDNLLSAFLVALDDNDKVVGYAGVQVVLDEGYITNVAVRPECRRQGIAAKLLQVFLDFAKANSLAFLTLDARQEARMGDGFDYCMQHLDIKKAVPMHSFGNYDAQTEFLVSPTSLPYREKILLLTETIRQAEV